MGGTVTSASLPVGTLSKKFSGGCYSMELIDVLILILLDCCMWYAFYF